VLHQAEKDNSAAAVRHNGGFKAVIEQTACIGMVVVFRGREQLCQFCKTMKRY